MSDTSKKAVRDEGTEAEVSREDGVSEAAAEAEIAALVEAEREAEAEELAVAEAEAAAESEEPVEESAGVDAAESEEPTEEPAGVDAGEAAEPEEASAGVDAGVVEEPAESSEGEETADAVASEEKPAASTKKSKPPRPAAPAVTRLAVLGSPIGHSQSPALHRAAYAALGLDWRYEPVDVAADALEGFIDGLGEEWRGLSLTMPLKQAVLPLLSDVERVAEQTGVANTVLFDGEEVRGFNTDVAGMVRALRAAGLTSARYVHILGGGATAASALVAVAELGAEWVDVHVRNLERSVWLEGLAHELGLRVRLRSLAQADRALAVPELVVSTLPGGASTPVLYTDSTRRRALLLDVAYDPWPSTLSAAWDAVGGRVVSGLAMLAQQALLQVRVFVSGDPLEPLPDEDEVLAAMLDAVGIDAAGASVSG